MHTHTHTHTFRHTSLYCIAAEREKTDFDPLLFPSFHIEAGRRKKKKRERESRALVRQRQAELLSSFRPAAFEVSLIPGTKGAGERERIFPSMSSFHAGYLIDCDFQQTINNVRGAPLGSTAIITSVDAVCVMRTHNGNQHFQYLTHGARLLSVDILRPTDYIKVLK